MDYRLCRSVSESTAKYVDVAILGKNMKGKFVGLKPGPYFDSAIVEVEGTPVVVHVEAVREEPLFWCEGKPVYVGTKLWCMSRRMIWLAHINGIHGSSVNNTPLDEYNPEGIGTGSSYISDFSFKDPRPGAAEQRDEPMFVNVYTSLPHGTKQFPGSVVFKTQEAAEQAKHSAPLLGTFKLVAP